MNKDTKEKLTSVAVVIAMITIFIIAYGGCFLLYASIFYGHRMF